MDRFRIGVKERRAEDSTFERPLGHKRGHRRSRSKRWAAGFQGPGTKIERGIEGHKKNAEA